MLATQNRTQHAPRAALDLPDHPHTCPSTRAVDFPTSPSPRGDFADSLGDPGQVEDGVWSLLTVSLTPSPDDTHSVKIQTPTMKHHESATLLLILLLNLSTTLATIETTLQLHPHYTLTWSKDDSQKIITFTTSVRTRGWIGFGISPNGGMINSDIVTGWVTNGEAHFQDRYAVGESMPLIDNKQDWRLHEGGENGTHTHLTFSRPYKTCDGERDRDISDGVVRVIWAYGEEDPSDLNSINIHELSKRGSKSIRLLMDDPTPEQLEDDLQHWDILAKQSRVPTKETTYFCTLHQSPYKEKRHIVKYEAIIQPGNENHVHHMVLFRCQHPDPLKLQIYLTKQDHECIPGLNNMPPDLLNCRSFYIIWTVGGGPYTFPPEAGLPIGGGDLNSYYYMLEVHYDNKYGVKDIVDNSGMRLYTTKKLRNFDADNYVMGSVEDYRLLLPPRQSELVAVGHCSPECHDDLMPEGGIKVLSIMVHAHLYATRIKARHFRGNLELEPLVDERFYDFNYQDYWHYPEVRLILRGDQVTVECYYNTSGVERVVLGGFQTSEEMCHVFLAYYPRMPSDRSCFSAMSPSTIATISGVDELSPTEPELDPIILSPPSLKGLHITPYLQNKSDWDDDLINSSLYLLRTAARVPVCWYRATEHIHIAKDLIGYPKNLIEWSETRVCHLNYGSVTSQEGGSSWLIILIVVTIVILAGLSYFKWRGSAGGGSQGGSRASFTRVG